MTMLRLNGWRIPVAIRTHPQKKLLQHGELNPRFRNRPVRHRKSIEREFVVRTTKLEEICADTLEGLIEGRNHHFPFVHDAWSESGLGPELGSDWSLINSGGPVSTRGHYIISQAPDGLLYNPQFIDDNVAPDGGRWTLIYWYLLGGVWTRRVLRSDGSRFIDGAATATLFTEVTVDNGGVLFNIGTRVADVVMLSFYACDEFIQQEYDWVSGLNMVFYAGFDDTFNDVVANRNGTPTGVGFNEGQVHRAVEGNAAGDQVVYAIDDEIAIFDQTERTWEMWVQVDTAVAGTRILDNQTGGAGFRLSTFTGTSNDIALFIDIEYDTATDANLQADAFDTGGWHHVVVTWDDTTNRLQLYVDGSLVTNVFTDTAGVGNVEDDTTNDLVVMNAPAGGQGLRGSVDDLKIYNRKLTAAQITERYECGLVGRRTPEPQSSSAMPRLTLWGDIEGCREPIEVIGEVTDGDYVTHGSSSGYVNNDRELAIKLHDVKGRPDCDRIDPEMGWWFATPMLDRPENSFDGPNPARSKFVLGPVGIDFTNRGQLGPFNYRDAAWEFSGDYFNISDNDIGEWLYGAQGCTCLAWVRPTTLGLDQNVFEIWINDAGSSRILLRMDTTNAFRFGGRSSLADTNEQRVSNTTLAIDEWHFIGGTMDLPNDEVRVFYNGVSDATPHAASFAQNRFSNERKTAAPHARIGDNLSNIRPLQGQIANVLVWRRELTDAEIFKVYELGKKGIFS